MEYITGNDIKHFLANTPQITFEITECCNLACTYCGYGPLYNNKDPRKNRNLSEETGILFINYMVNLWEKGFLDITNDTIYVSFYGGEPLLNMNFIRHIVNYIRSKLEK